MDTCHAYGHEWKDDISTELCQLLNPLLQQNHVKHWSGRRQMWQIITLNVNAIIHQSKYIVCKIGLKRKTQQYAISK